MTTAAQTTFPGFAPEDFDVFAIDGLEPRMEALIARVRPKLHQLGAELAPTLSVLCGEEMYPHVAKHARRKVHPPNDTWVAYAPNKRGYKAHPHFQIGLFESHLFIQFALIYEATAKESFAKQALKRVSELRKQIPSGFTWSGDHTEPGGTLHSKLSADELQTLLSRLQTVKSAELLCGLIIDRHDPLLRDGSALLAKAEETFASLLPLYRLAR
ncbi:hypothetical protein PA598K_04672 [Paenibacillus sp. 598K]|uniref:YktB family protein n=1 Tax=Paenibacillus sp. 598K TaxID=1117987 RepID=UPI000FFAAB15|nr:DUF1054 domain-containing protein [Paenibacillus sp. 598K]GBF76220.1 hypothetical protein PA598K_04672 [Paenibacillus sp. 598K]